MDQYHLGRVIGKGSFGEVFLCQKRDNPRQMLCLKKVDLSSMSPTERMSAVQEVSLLAQLRHPCIVSYIDHFIDDIPDRQTLCIVMEYCSGGDLSKTLKEASGPVAEDVRACCANTAPMSTRAVSPDRACILCVCCVCCSKCSRGLPKSSWHCSAAIRSACCTGTSSRKMCT